MAMERGAANRATVEAVEKRRGYGDYASGRNVSKAERVLSIIGGTALALFGLRRRSLAGLGIAVLGGTLIRRGITGHSRLYDRLGRGTAGAGEGVRGNLGVKVERAVVVYAPRDRLYRSWRNFANLPRFMQNLQSVQTLDARRSHWVAKGPGGVPVEWDAEIINEVPNELIAWCSTGGNVDHAGSVRFEPGPGGRGTTVRVSLQYDPPGGSAGHTIASLIGGDAGARVEQDLEHLKRVIESGEAVA